MENFLFAEKAAKSNFVDKGLLDDLINKYGNDSFNILQGLVRDNYHSKDELGKIWADTIGYSYLNLEKTLFQTEAVESITEEVAMKYKIIPVYKIGDVLTIATSNPANNFILKEIERIAGMSISPVFALPDDISYFIELQYRTVKNIETLTGRVLQSAKLNGTDIINVEQLRKIAGNNAVIEMTKEIILFAIKEGASDIHIEPEEEIIRVRFRIDGILHEKLKLDREILPNLLSRLKVLANVDIIEKRNPQDGGIQFPIGNRNVDIRFSSIPTVNGEKIVLRILGITGFKDILGLDELYFSKEILEKFKRIIKMPNGMFFITGPTGSGKTSTLFSALKHINSPEINISSIEDPVEYRLKGVNQVQVNHVTGLDFAKGLRAFLRQDPDVILIGEIRDLETAKIAAQAALTGHFVFATMHTNNSLQAITRLVEIGVEPFLVAPSVLAVMAQRLVRKLCNNCKEKYLLTPEEINEVFIAEEETDVYFYKANGCQHCNNTGFKGRLPIQEMFIINEEMRYLISHNASILEIHDCANRSGFKSMWYDGVKKVLQGYTTIGEVNRVVLELDNF